MEDPRRSEGNNNELDALNRGDISALTALPKADARRPLAYLGANARSARWNRVLQAFLPALVVAVVLLAGSAAYYVRWGFNTARWHGAAHGVPLFLAFNDIGRVFASKIGDQAEAVAHIGYDGQFFYYMARDPRIITVCAHHFNRCPVDASPLREERIVYPMVARVVALSNPAWIHVSLFAVDFAAILVTVVVVGLLCAETGASRWLAVAAGMFCGEMLGLLRDLADPFAAMWFVLAIYFMRKDRPYLFAVCAAATMLSREQMVLIMPFLWLPWLMRRRWRTAILTGIVAFAPFAAWQVTLRLIFGQWGLTASTQTTHGIGIPFHALWEYRNGPEFLVTVAFVAVPLLFTMVVAASWLRKYGIRALLSEPLPLVALIYCVLLTLTAYAEWEGMWNSARLVTPAALVGLILVSQLNRKLRWSYSAMLALTALAPLLMLPKLF